MPVYVYRCPVCHNEIELAHSMNLDPLVECACGSAMARRPQVVRVNWGGLKPSQGELAPVVKDMIADAPALRDKMVPHMSNRLARLNGVLP